MKSAWFWGTEHWAAYLRSYSEVHPECLTEWKSSPLADDHDLGLAYGVFRAQYEKEEHHTQVLDLRLHQWSDIRKSYHSIIHRAQDRYAILPRAPEGIAGFKALHIHANGRQVRPDETYRLQGDWLRDGYGLLVAAQEPDTQDWHACAYWIVYQGCAYYCSGPSTERNVQHAVIWKSLELLKARGVTLVELGQIDGETEKERNIGKFKQGFGGTAMPFIIVKKVW